MSKLRETNSDNSANIDGIDEILESDLTTLPLINNSDLNYNNQKSIDIFKTPSPEPENSHMDSSSKSIMKGLKELPFSHSVFSRLAKPLKRASLSIEIPNGDKYNQENEAGLVKKKIKTSGSKSELAKIALANFFIHQDIASEFQDQLILITQARATIQSDPAGLIGPMLDKIFDGQEGKANMAWIKKIQTYNLNNKNITHREEKISANIWPFEFANQSSEASETLNVLTSKCETIENFEVKDKEKSVKVDLGSKEKVILNSDNLVVWFKRFAYDREKKEVIKVMSDVKLESLKVKDNDESDVELVPSAILFHNGNSALTGHYVTYLLAKKDQEIKWFCFDDSSVSEVSLNDIDHNGIPIKNSKNCCFVNYCNKSKLDSIITNVDEVMAFNNFYKNHCWFNASLVFLQSFKEFRDLAKDLIEIQSSEALTDSAFQSCSSPVSPSSQAKSPSAENKTSKSRNVK